MSAVSYWPCVCSLRAFTVVINSWSWEADGVSECYSSSQSKTAGLPLHIWRFPLLHITQQLPACWTGLKGKCRPGGFLSAPASRPEASSPLHSGDACSQPVGQVAHRARTRRLPGNVSPRNFFLLEPALAWEVLVVRNPPTSEETQDT